MADTTYPAVELSCIVRNDQAKYYGHESGHARGRVNLRKDSDPENKCVPVRTTIVQRYGRCPRMTLHSKSRVVTNSQLRRGGGPSYHRYNMSDRERGGGRGWVDSQIKTSHGMPELRGCRCQRVGSMDFSNSGVWP